MIKRGKRRNEINLQREIIVNTSLKLITIQNKYLYTVSDRNSCRADLATVPITCHVWTLPLLSSDLSEKLSHPHKLTPHNNSLWTSFTNPNNTNQHQTPKTAKEQGQIDSKHNINVQLISTKTSTTLS